MGLVRGARAHIGATGLGFVLRFVSVLGTGGDVHERVGESPPPSLVLTLLVPYLSSNAHSSLSVLQVMAALGWDSPRKALLS